MSFEYIRSHYGVPAEIGRRVKVSGRLGIIAADRDYYIGVNFDDAKPGAIVSIHPTCDVEYLDMDDAYYQITQDGIASLHNQDNPKSL